MCSCACVVSSVCKLANPVADSRGAYAVRLEWVSIRQLRVLESPGTRGGTPASGRVARLRVRTSRNLHLLELIKKITSFLFFLSTHSVFPMISQVSRTRFVEEVDLYSLINMA